MPKRSFPVDRAFELDVRSYYASCARNHRGVPLVDEMYELAPGVIVVIDTASDLDIFFDPKRWDCANKEIIDRGRKGRVRGDGFAIIPGGRVNITSPTWALVEAPRYLRPVEDSKLTWHHEPWPVTE